MTVSQMEPNRLTKKETQSTVQSITYLKYNHATLTSDIAGTLSEKRGVEGSGDKKIQIHS